MRRVRSLPAGCSRFNLNGKQIHQVAIPFHFGSAGPVIGDAANDLLAISGEPNVTIMEAKRSFVTSCPANCPADRSSMRGLHDKSRRAARRICIPNNRRPARRKAANSPPVTASTENQDERHVKPVKR